VACFPVHQSARGLGQTEQEAAEFFPARAEVVLLDQGERGTLGTVIRVEAATLMLVPTPSRTLDPVYVEHSKIGGEAIEIALGGTLALHLVPFGSA
jgi:hypothetical protein